MNKLLKILSIISILTISSCILMFDNGYKGDVNTSLSGILEISDSNCFIPTEEPDETKYIINVVFHLITKGDKYVSVCVSKNNYDAVISSIEFNEGNNYWFLDRNLNITFYASDTAAQPGGNSVGQSSEVLISGFNQSNEYTSMFYLNTYSKDISYSCNYILSDTAYIDTIWLADLDMSVFEKKPIIVARVPLCGNYPLGSAANPLYSEKNLKK